MRIRSPVRTIEGAGNFARNRGLSILAMEVADIVSDAFSPLGDARARYSIAKLKENRPTKDLDHLLDFAFTFKAAGRRLEPVQVRSEICALLEILSSSRPRCLLEIGSAHGGTLLLFAGIADPSATLLSLDFAGYARWMVPVMSSFAQNEQRIRLIHADSHDPNTLERIQSILNHELLDFVFIDGDHSFSGVREDFQMYSSLVRNGGIVAFHDIVEHPKYTGCEVNRFWNAIKPNYDYKEIVESWTQGWGGIGVLYL